MPATATAHPLTCTDFVDHPEKSGVAPALQQQQPVGQSVVDALHGCLAAGSAAASARRRRKSAGWASLVSGAVITQLDEHPQVRLDGRRSGFPNRGYTQRDSSGRSWLGGRI